MSSAVLYLMVGSYTTAPNTPNPSGKQDSLRLVSLNTSTGELSLIRTLGATDDVSYFAADPLNPSSVYAVSEGGAEGSVLYHIYAPDFKNVDINQLGVLPSPQGCYVSVATTGDPLVACYGGGVYAGRGTAAKLDLEAPVDPTDPVRQDKSHPHCAVPWPAAGERVYVVADLGTDRVYVISMSKEIEGVIATPPGTGPRHVLFHPTRPLLAVVGELSNEVQLYKVDASSRRGELLQRVPIIDPGKPQDHPSHELQNAAHLAFTSDHRFLLVSNRGRVNDVVVLRLADDRDHLEVVSKRHSEGVFPRFFTLIDNKFLIVANQQSDSLVVFGFDKDTGAISEKPLSVVQVPAPIAVQVLESGSVDVV